MSAPPSVFPRMDHAAATLPLAVASNQNASDRIFIIPPLCQGPGRPSSFPFESRDFGAAWNRRARVPPHLKGRASPTYRSGVQPPATMSEPTSPPENNDRAASDAQAAADEGKPLDQLLAEAQ